MHLFLVHVVVVTSVEQGTVTTVKIVVLLLNGSVDERTEVYTFVEAV